MPKLKKYVYSIQIELAILTLFEYLYVYDMSFDDAYDHAVEKVENDTQKQLLQRMERLVPSGFVTQFKKQLRRIISECVIPERRIILLQFYLHGLGKNFSVRQTKAILTDIPVHFSLRQQTVIDLMTAHGVPVDIDTIPEKYQREYSRMPAPYATA